MANFSLSFLLTAICVFLLTIVGIVSITLVENTIEATAIAAFFFLPSLVLSLAFLAQDPDQKEESDFRGTVGFLIFLLLSAICVGLFEVIWPGFLPEHLVAVGGGSLAILTIMASFFLIVDGGSALKGKVSFVYLMSGWLTLLCVTLYIVVSTINAREGPRLQDFATMMKSMTIAFSLINISFLWVIIKLKPEEASEAEITEEQTQEEEIIQEEPEETAQAEEEETSQEEEG